MKCINRRRLLATAGLATVAAFPAAAKLPGRPKPILVAERVSVAAVQRAAVASADLGPARAIALNLAAMDQAIAGAQAVGRKHLIAFSDRALQGKVGSDLRVAAIFADGPEVAAVAGMARRHGVHLAFGALLANRERRGEVMRAALLIDADGCLIACEDGRGAQVYETAIGRICFGAAVSDAEIFLRTPDRDSAPINTGRCFTVFTAEAEHGRPAGSAIYGLGGEVLAAAGAAWQQVVTASLPIADLRAQLRQTTIA